MSASAHSGRSSGARVLTGRGRNSRGDRPLTRRGLAASLATQSCDFGSVQNRRGSPCRRASCLRTVRDLLPRTLSREERRGRTCDTQGKMSAAPACEPGGINPWAVHNRIVEGGRFGHHSSGVAGPKARSCRLGLECTDPEPTEAEERKRRRRRQVRRRAREKPAPLAAGDPLASGYCRAV